MFMSYLQNKNFTQKILKQILNYVSLSVLCRGEMSLWYELFSMCFKVIKSLFWTQTLADLKN